MLHLFLVLFAPAAHAQDASLPPEPPAAQAPQYDEMHTQLLASLSAISTRVEERRARLKQPAATSSSDAMTVVGGIGDASKATLTIDRTHTPAVVLVVNGRTQNVPAGYTAVPSALASSFQTTSRQALERTDLAKGDVFTALLLAPPAGPVASGTTPPYQVVGVCTLEVGVWTDWQCTQAAPPPATPAP